jgi:hypothetical protein
MTPAQCRGARAMLGWKQIDLAKAAGLATYMPVFYYEKHGDAIYETAAGPKRRVSNTAVAKIKAAFEEAGIEFVGETGINLRRAGRVIVG